MIHLGICKAVGNDDRKLGPGTSIKVINVYVARKFLGREKNTIRNPELYLHSVIQSSKGRTIREGKVQREGRTKETDAIL
jgi:hypothetical protein